MLKFIPNLLTLCNLLCGCIGIYYAFKENATDEAALFVGLAAIFDFLDGFAARLLNATSPIGKQLDSLADMVSFGVLPAAIMFDMFDTIILPEGLPKQFVFITFFIALMSAMRLAKFNIDEKQTKSFRGVPTPANAIFIASLPLIVHSDLQFAFLICRFDVLISITLLCSIWLVLPIPIMAFKFANLSLKDNIFKYLTIICAIVGLFLFNYTAIPFIILIYVLLSQLEAAIVLRKSV